MLRWLTAGESHGPALVAIMEGLPGGIRVTTEDVRVALARRRHGYGRGARMNFERDDVEFLGGIRHGRTLGSPVAVRISNLDDAVRRGHVPRQNRPPQVRKFPLLGSLIEDEEHVGAVQRIDSLQREVIRVAGADTDDENMSRHGSTFRAGRSRTAE